jgi:hypothetical protein
MSARFQSRARAVQNRKARTGDFRRAFQIQNAQTFAQINVVARLEYQIRAAR